jgi:hypothetical protein
LSSLCFSEFIPTRVESGEVLIIQDENMVLYFANTVIKSKIKIYRCATSLIWDLVTVLQPMDTAEKAKMSVFVDITAKGDNGDKDLLSEEQQQIEAAINLVDAYDPWSRMMSSHSLEQLQKIGDAELTWCRQEAKLYQADSKTHPLQCHSIQIKDGSVTAVALFMSSCSIPTKTWKLVNLVAKNHQHNLEWDYLVYHRVEGNKTRLSFRRHPLKPYLSTLDVSVPRGGNGHLEASGASYPGIVTMDQILSLGKVTSSEFLP